MALAARCAALLVGVHLAGCAVDVPQGDILPGHSRPVFEHDWPHPRDLAFEDSGFRPADPAAALVRTSEGVRAYILPDTADPLVEISAVVPLGRQFEADGERGAAEAASGILGRRLAERLGASIVARSQTSQASDLTRLSVEVLAEDWRAALDAMIATLRGFGAQDVGGGPARAGGPGGGGGGRGGGGGGGGAARAIAELTRLLAVYPIAPPDPGTIVTPESVQRFAQRALVPAGVVLGIGGDVPRAEAEAALREATAGWTAVPGAAPGTARAPTLAAARPMPAPLHTFDVPGFMSWLAVGHPMTPIAPGNAAAVAVLKEIVNIRLNITTREIRGLTNRALLDLPPASDGAGLLYVRAGSRSESVGPLIRYAAEELSRIREPDGAPTLDELEQAKGGLVLGAWQDSLDGARRTAATYATEAVRRGSLDRLMAWPDAVRAVTAEDVTAAARAYIDPAALTAVVVGQIEEVRAARHPRWPVPLADVPAMLRPAGSRR